VADLSVTAAQVSAGAAATVAHTVAAVAITAGQTVYTNASGQLALADANVTVAEVTNVSIPSIRPQQDSIVPMSRMARLSMGPVQLLPQGLSMSYQRLLEGFARKGILPLDNG
jgi:hypothetical protein